MAQKIEKETQNEFLDSHNPSAEAGGTKENSTFFGKQPIPIFTIESEMIGDDVFETNEVFINNNSQKSSTKPLDVMDNGFHANTNNLKHSHQRRRYLSTGEPNKSESPNIKHSHSVSDLTNYLHPYGRSISKVNNNDVTNNVSMGTFASGPEGGDNGSYANSDVNLRHPQQLESYLSSGIPCRKGPTSIKHSQSMLDLSMKYRQPYDRVVSKDQKSLILPLVLNNRPRSYVSSLNSPTLQHLMSNSFSNSNSNLTQPYTSQERILPFMAADNDGFQNDGYNNGGFVLSNSDFDAFKQGRFTPLTSSSSDQHMSTNPEAKKRMFTDVLSTSLSTIYAILIVTLGVSFYVMDYVDIQDDSLLHLAEGYSLTLLIVALLYLLYLIIDIAIYKYKRGSFEKLMEELNAEHVELKETSEGVACDVKLHKALALRKQLDHRYCFNKDRHSSNFYLKIGASGFCFGHLIHSFLILSYRGILFSSPEIHTPGCFNTASLIIEILYPIYSVILLFFIFKYSNVIINKHRDFHRFGFMHCLSASLCFWVWTIFRETAEYIQHQRNKYGSGDEYEASATINGTLSEYGADKKLLGNLVPFRFTKMCEHEQFNIVYHNFSPYLYPFSVEYSILVVGILYIVWINIGLCTSSKPEEEDHHGEDTRECKNYRPIEYESNVTVYVDCHASNKGLFGGFITLVFAVVSTIVFFITFFSSDNVSLQDTGRIINSITAEVIMFLMILAAIYAYMQMRKLDVNEAAHNSMDNFLCLMCLPAFFINGIFSIIPAVIYGNTLAIIGVTFEIIQILIQTPFIIDGMARSSNSKELRKKKPGREFVIFLIICNVSMWIMQTFEVKSHGLDQYRQEFYSKDLWSIVGHICLPLMMFYRFHSSVCIGDIWKYAYLPSGH